MKFLFILKSHKKRKYDSGAKDSADFHPNKKRKDSEPSADNSEDKKDKSKKLKMISQRVVASLTPFYSKGQFSSKVIAALDVYFYCNVACTAIVQWLHLL